MCLGKGVPSLSPARSLDLALMIFFSGITEKIKYSASYPRNILDLKTRTREAGESITEETLQKMFANIENGLSLVVCQSAGHFENLLNL